MSHRIALFVVGFFILASPAVGQQKDDLPKAAKPKVPLPAVPDPVKAAEDPDFAVQGEYVGTVTINGAAAEFGVQLVARGGGKFDGKGFVGGLPGAGWDGSPPHPGTAARDGGKVVVKNHEGAVSGEIVSGVLTLSGPTPGALKKIERKSPTLGAKPPAGAVVLFAKPGDEGAKTWTNGKLLELSDGKFLHAGCVSKKLVGGFQAHVEFRLPWMPEYRGQQRANSGVYVQSRYEVQILDSFGLPGEKNECGALYTQTAPKVNMCLPPLVWQAYNIDFTPAAFDADGTKTTPARITVVHNGVTVQDNVELPKQTGYGKKEDATPGPLVLQDHRSPVVFRNVWLVEKK